MTLFLLFAAIGTLAYVSVAALVAAGATTSHLAFALAFTIGVSLWIFDVGAVLYSVARYAHTWLLLVALVLPVAIAFAMAGARNDAGNLSSANEPAGIADHARGKNVRLLGQRLFIELGRIECHSTGIGPELANRFGRPFADAGCGVLAVDEDYIRESILNPTAVVAAGFAPIMPSFAGKINDSELASLVAYVASLSGTTIDEPY